MRILTYLSLSFILTSCASTNPLDPWYFKPQPETPFDSSLPEVSKPDASIDVNDSTPVLARTRMCSPDHWCWYHPTPHGNRLNGVWGFRDNDVWAVGFNGTILHWNGNQVDSISSETDRNILGIWGAAPNDVWAVGEDIVLHWNGSQWNTITLPKITRKTFQLNGIWGVSSKDIWAVGSDGLALHWNGTNWEENTKGLNIDLNLKSVWFHNSQEVWVSADVSRFWGNDGLIYRWNGTEWIFQNIDEAKFVRNFSGFHGIDSKNIWVIGQGWFDEFSGVLQWNGTTWSKTDIAKNVYLTSVWSTNARDVWVAGASVDNHSENFISHWNGTSWNQMHSPNLIETVDGCCNWALLTKLWSENSNNVWAVGQLGTMVHWNGSQWTRAYKNYTRVTVNALNAVWANHSQDVWAVGDNGTIVHYDGTDWKKSRAGIEEEYLYSIWGSGPSDIWVTGDSINFGGSTILHWNGKQWNTIDIGNHGAVIYDIWGTGPNDVWMIGSGGTVMRWNGTQWTREQRSTKNLYKMHALNSNDIWIVGDYGQVLHWNGSVWAEVPIKIKGKTPRQLMKVWGSSSKDIWVIGDAELPERRIGSIFLHWNGTDWSEVDLPNRDEPILYFEVWGTSATNVWVQTSKGTLNWNGQEWKSTNIGTRYPLNDSWVVNSKDIWVVGEGGSILHYEP